VGKLISADDGAARLGVTSRRFRVLCRERRIKGARFIGARWFVPENFVVSPGARGPALTLAQFTQVRTMEKAIAQIQKISARQLKARGESPPAKLEKLVYRLLPGSKRK
jgi:hypothetical protein